MKLCPITSSFKEYERLQLSVSNVVFSLFIVIKKTLKREAAGPFFNIPIVFYFNFWTGA